MKLQNYWRQMRVCHIRELVWPMLEKQTSKKYDDREVDLEVSNENLDTAFDLIRKLLDGEEERRRSVESKASLFLSTISIATTLVVASSNLVNDNLKNVNAIRISMSISFILSLYMVRTVWFSVKALERGNYSVLGFKDINYSGDTAAYKKHLIISIFDKVKANSPTINNKVDNLAMAQAYFKRGIVTISIYALLVLLFLFVL